MTDNNDINNNNNEIQIQSSAYVSSQILHSESIPSVQYDDDDVSDSNNKSNSKDNVTNTFNNSRRYGKSRLNAGEEDDSAAAHYSGTMERFFQSEVRAVFFGGKDDAFLLLKVTVVAGFLVNLFGILVYMQYDDLIPHDPNDRHPHGLLHLLAAFESALSSYYSDGQIVVGWMLSCWFLGYNVISAMIWWQFERRESRQPDDYEIIPSTRLRRRAASAGGSFNDLSTAVDGNTHQSFRKHHNNPASKHDEEQKNPFDKSVVIISMPNGDFSVGKRQKVMFNALN